MQVATTRFGLLDVDDADLIGFPTGPAGLDDCRQWVLLADGGNRALGWLQSTTRPEVALAVVGPRCFAPDYQFRVFRRELAPLELERADLAHVLAIVSKNERGITLNLKAPIVINLARRLGRQVIANDDQPLQYELIPTLLRKTA